MSVCRADGPDGVRSEIDTTAICLGAALAREGTAEGEVGLMLFAYALLDLRAAAAQPKG